MSNSRKMLPPLAWRDKGKRWWYLSRTLCPLEGGAAQQELEPNESLRAAGKAPAEAHTERNTLASPTGAAPWPTWPEATCYRSLGIVVPYTTERQKWLEKNSGSKQENIPERSCMRKAHCIVC